MERSKAGVKLTSDGLKLLPYAKSLCEEYKKLQMQVDELNGLQSGIIRIGTFSSVATHWLPNIIKEFQKIIQTLTTNYCLEIIVKLKLDFRGQGRLWFLRIPTHKDLETIFLAKDKLLVVYLKIIT